MLRLPPAPEDHPRDIVCCLENFTLKEYILRTARRIGTINIDSQDIVIYQDLSSYTLQAQKAVPSWLAHQFLQQLNGPPPLGRDRNQRQRPSQPNQTGEVKVEAVHHNPKRGTIPRATACNTNTCE
ncbi:Hypothetical predicted protein [Pelobates cultripes]|uniref:Uncharacterized protein n=1 Tax=Pelobates cultripes TaxID=61616 RepID=A0AAD1S0V0_PELCU|nr:Hypothetical predicted protein [Pelobates cultripes]